MEDREWIEQPDGTFVQDRGRVKVTLIPGPLAYGYKFEDKETGKIGVMGACARIENARFAADSIEWEP